MKPCVYILKSKRDGKFYIGSTANLKQRLKHHFAKATPTTKRFGNLEFVFSQEYNNLSDARSVERKLKKLKRHDYIQKIIEEDYIKMRP